MNLNEEPVLFTSFILKIMKVLKCMQYILFTVILQSKAFISQIVLDEWKLKSLFIEIRLFIELNSVVTQL